MAGTIIVESSLSFLGLGPDPSKNASWGGLLRIAKNHLFEAPYIVLFPGLAILILVFGFNLFGDGLREQIDPRRNI
jgi:peptide/nickel transport system permease protein